MRHARTLSLCLLSVLALGAVAASGASAKLPEWGQCRETASGSGGKYGNANCTQQVKKVYGSYPGAYEWYPLGHTAGDMADLVSWPGSPVSPARIRFASGREILCSGSEEGEEEALSLDGANVVTDAPQLYFANCEEPVLALENDGEIPEGHEKPAGECESTGAGGFVPEITTSPEARNGRSSPPEGTTWGGSTEFLGEKTGSSPSVGISYHTTPERERFFPQITCESGEDSQPLNIQIGGHKRGERLVEEITPVNQMLNGAGFTATLRPQAGRQAVQALVNTGEWEPVTVEASTYFDGRNGEEGIYIPYEQRLAWEEAYGERNYSRYSNSLELKATP